MTQLLLLFGLFLLLFLLSRTLTQTISSLLVLVFHNQKVAIVIFSFLFLPGTFLHEIAHFIMAKLLFVPTHGMSLVPRIEGKSVRLGSVTITQTDFLRRMLIGIAPFLVGCSVIFLLLFLANEKQLPLFSLPMLAILYGIFEVGNTMFSSKKDMEGVLELLISVAFLCVLLYLLGVRFPKEFLTYLNSDATKLFFEKGTTLLFFPVTLDIILILLLKGFKRIIS